jgi:flagellar biogenesis protein FliO
MDIAPTSLLTAGATLVAVLALIWLAGRAARLGGLARRPASGRLLSVQDVITLDSRRRLYLIACRDKQVLLLTGGTQDVVLSWPGEPGPATEPSP